MLLEDFNETVRLDPIHLRPCAYLHNCESGLVINAAHYAAHTKQAPSFLKDDAEKLREFIKAHVKYGDSGETSLPTGKLTPLHKTIKPGHKWREPAVIAAEGSGNGKLYARVKLKQ
jgi:hypothetical protein